MFGPGSALRCPAASGWYFRGRSARRWPGCGEQAVQVVVDDGLRLLDRGLAGEDARGKAVGLADGSDPGDTEARLMHAHALKGEIQRADDALGEAEDSLRLRPPALRSERTAVPLRNGLETLERAALTIRGLARSITDVSLPDTDGEALAANALDMLAEVLRRLAAALRAYGNLVRADLTTGCVPDGSELERHLTAARQHQDRLAPVLRHTPDATAAGWPLRGEILVHVNRLINGLRAEHIGRARDNERSRPWPAWARVARSCHHRSR
jgi:hypothetical protein